MIKKYEACRGISFSSFKQWKIEIWYAPRGYEIQPHTHENEDIKLVFLFGHNIRFHRRKKDAFLGQSFLARFENIGKIFTINAGDEHSFTVSNWPLLFMNIEKWKDGIKPSSASQDLQLTKKDSIHAST